MGSPDFALPTLRALNQAFDVVGIVTQPDRPAGRGRKLQPSDVKLLGQKLAIPLIQPESLKDSTAIEQLNIWAPDVIVVAAFGQILKKNVLNLPPYGCINVHASLLPRWRGAAPVQAAVLFDQVTGVTIMKMDEGLDTGPNLSQRSIPISQDITAGALFDQLAQMGADLLLETLPKYFRGEINLFPQDHQEATYAPRLKKSDGELDFNQPASFLARKVRAFNPWPGTYQFINNKRMNIIRAHALPMLAAQPGKRYCIDDKPAWGTGKGLLVLDEVQVAGKGRVSGEAFLCGAKYWIDDKERNHG